ncbi:MAG TPA: ABC transporter ATP-binding protein [Pseudogracilibacillus sp.]|nr:ABC transporter ATP-binding protein [Pseudogracilibacillus sp.]
MIEIKNLTQDFSNGKGIFDVSFNVNKGEVFGFLGPNGSGKTTTIRHLMGYMKPQVGQTTINNLDTWKNQSEVRKSLGYLPGEISFLDGLTGESFLNMMVGMQGINNKSRREDLIELFQLDTKLSIRKMSKGTKQKVGIITTFMHDPDIYILDEPTAGLDPLMQKTFIDLVLKEKSRGKTFLISSHSLPEIERTCDRIAIIREGKIVTIKDIHELHSMQRKSFNITLSKKEDVIALLESELTVEKVNDFIVRIDIQNNYDMFFNTLSKYHVKNISADDMSLEHTFMEYYKREDVSL